MFMILFTIVLMVIVIIDSLGDCLCVFINHSSNEVTTFLMTRPDFTGKSAC